MIFNLFANPSQRLYWGYIIVFSLICLVLAAIGVKGAKRSISLKTLFHSSSLLDIQVLALNQLIKYFIIIILGYFTFIQAESISLKFLYFFSQFTEFNGFKFKNPVYYKIFYTFISFIIADFFRFYLHYLLHQHKFLWKFHKLHHSAEVLTPLTVGRVHFVEMFLGMVRAGLSNTLSIILFLSLFQVPITGLEILGVNALGFIFNLLWGNFRHSHLRISFGWFESVLVSPSQHQDHHTQKGLGKNFGVVFSIWDRLFKTHSYSRVKMSPLGLKNFKPKSILEAYKI